MRLAIRKAKTMPLGVAISKFEVKKAAEDAAEEEESIWLVEEADGEGEKPDKGLSAGNVV